MSSDAVSINLNRIYNSWNMITVCNVLSLELPIVVLHPGSSFHRTHCLHVQKNQNTVRIQIKVCSGDQSFLRVDKSNQQWVYTANKYLKPS